MLKSFVNCSPLRVLIFFTLGGCASFFGKPSNTPPEIVAAMTLDEALEAGMDFGGATLVEVKKLIKYRKAWKDVEARIAKDILRNHEEWSSLKLIHAANLYMSSSPQHPEVIFAKLSRSSKPGAVHVGWHMASVAPSKKMAKEIESVLTEAITEDELEKHFDPKMAEAIASNRLKNSYTVLRQGLFKTQNIVFAQAMRSLEPKKASWDFMDFLAQAPLDELRQLNLLSVDVLTCMEILQHFTVQPPPLNHPRFENLFYFAISRNAAMSELTKKILEGFYPRSGPTLALMLARQSSWIQIAFVENARKDMTPVLGLFLSELKEATAQSDVVDDIEEIKR